MKIEEILSDLIRIKSVNPPGGETEVCRYLKGLLEREGIAVEIIEPAPGRGNLIAQVGEGERSLLYLSHTDVVPVSGEWSFDPFGGEIRDGFVLGRGALDCKGLVAAEVYALLYVAKHFSLKGKLILAATADEEVGGGHGVEYLLQNYREKILADFAINEGAEDPLRIKEGEIVFFIQVGEKGVCWTRLRAKGVACHGSVPTLGDNAVVKMAQAISRLARYKPKVRLVPETRHSLQVLADMKGLKLKVNQKNVDQVIDCFEDRAFREYLRAITRMPISPNFIQGGMKTNIVPDSCQCDVDIRVLPGQKKDGVEDLLREIVGGEIDIEIPDFNPASFSPSDSFYHSLILDTIQEMHPEAAILSCISSGATDSRYLRKSGISSYGVAVMNRDFDPALKSTVHGRNERIDLASLTSLGEFLINLARNYLT